MYIVICHLDQLWLFYGCFCGEFWHFYDRYCILAWFGCRYGAIAWFTTDTAAGLVCHGRISLTLLDRFTLCMVSVGESHSTKRSTLQVNVHFCPWDFNGQKCIFQLKGGWRVDLLVEWDSPYVYRDSRSAPKSSPISRALWSASA